MFGSKSEGVFNGQKREIPNLMRVNLIIVRRQEDLMSEHSDLH
jgi:hypothetical protein